jgi:ribosomal protein L40E
MTKGEVQMDKLLYVCNECDAMHGDETDHCQTCGCDSVRSVPEVELLDGMQWD